jgi:hypothetical protein
MDYLLQFTDEATAQAALPQLYVADEGCWRGDVCIPNVRVYRLTGTGTDADGNPTELREYQTGWFIRVSTDTGITPFDPTGLVAEPVFAN